MGLLKEYLEKVKNPGFDLVSELTSLIKNYNEYRGRYLIIYNAAMHKGIASNQADIGINQTDYYYLKDILRDYDAKYENADVYIETPGGSGTATEEIVKLLHNRFKNVAFVVSGEAKSAGTIMVLSGNDIIMTETGSLGPIDAQIPCGRSVVSAYDYLEWLDQKYIDAKANKLNKLDAIIIAQITPGEIGGMNNSMNFAIDLVKRWLVEYKFSNWDVTETRHRPVTLRMKKMRAKKIAKDLVNHSKWRTHGRSLKIEDIKEIGLKIINADDEDEKLADLIYRIQIVCRILFDRTSIYKLYITADNLLTKTVVSSTRINSTPIIGFEISCQNCGQKHKIYAIFNDDPVIKKKYEDDGFKPYPRTNKLSCDCGAIIDLTGIRQDLEQNAKKKVLLK